MNNNARTLRVHAPAKINLTLYVLGQRPDGYHELATIMVPLTLADELEIIFKPQPVSDIRIITAEPELQDPHTNLAALAAAKFLQAGRLNAAVQLKLKKNIPLGAGLAGGSSDAAAVLRGLQQLTAALEPEQLRQLAEELGSDVPFCLLNQPALATGRGEQLTPLKNALPMEIVILKPDFSLSTAAIFKAWSPDPQAAPAGHEAFLAAWELQDLKALCSYMHTHLEATVRRRYPEIETLKQHLLAAGALRAQMSGSGPSVFGVFADAAAARQACRQFKNLNALCLHTRTQVQQREADT